MGIKFTTKSGDKLLFDCHWEMIPGFCAWDQASDFELADEEWGGGMYDRGWDDDEDGDKWVAESRLFRTVLVRYFIPKYMREGLSRTSYEPAGLHIFMGDQEKGVADTYLFPYVPKKPFTMYGIRFACKLSEYYINPNTNNKCRHLIIETSAVEEK